MALLSVWSRGVENWSIRGALREGNIPILWCPVIFGHVLALIWKSFLEIMRTAAPLIRVGNVCITKSVKLLHYNKNRRHFDPENWMTSTLHEVGALLSV